jgi:hypothetical protein
LLNFGHLLSQGTALLQEHSSPLGPLYAFFIAISSLFAFGSSYVLAGENFRKSKLKQQTCALEGLYSPVGDCFMNYKS